MQKILILGKKGMLGQELVKVFDDKNYELTAWDKEDFDITAEKKTVSAGIAHLLDDHVSRPGGHDLVRFGRVDRVSVDI